MGYKDIPKSAQYPDNLRFLSIATSDFTHAALLLGNNPQRFRSDLRFYLATVNEYFRGNSSTREISIPAGSNSDIRRRLSEDLAVGLAVHFMVKVFGIKWESVSQIPRNTKLSRKTPDFQGFSQNDERYLFEVKGTTGLATLERALSKALGQVKQYPEQAQTKLAILSYLSADERFFPSTSFIVDPPAMPEPFRPDPETSRLLHFENVLAFSGLPQTASTYVSSLSRRLKHKYKAEQASYSPRIAAQRDELQNQFDQESSNTQRAEYGNHEFRGQRIDLDADGIAVFLGASMETLKLGLNFDDFTNQVKSSIEVQHDRITSVLGDGTMLQFIRNK